MPPNKAIVGDYGFAHESGIHTHGVLNDPWTYEPYPPELVGNIRRLTIGKQSGKGMIKHKITELSGNVPDDETVCCSRGYSQRHVRQRTQSIAERGRIQENPSRTKNSARKRQLLLNNERENNPSLILSTGKSDS